MQQFMWSSTALTQLLGIELPIIQAPMAGGATTAELIAEVSNAGGLGSLGAGYMTADEIRRAIQQIRALTDKPFAVNLFIPQEHHASPLQLLLACERIELSCIELEVKINPNLKSYVPDFTEQMRVIVEEKVPILSFTFGVLNPTWITQLKSRGTVLIGTATHLAEAYELEKQGVDVIVAQGSEAGGHRGTFIGAAENSLLGLCSLVPSLVDKIKVPIVAAGGIMDGRGIAGALALGASGVQMGTAFLTCPAAGISDIYKKTLLTIKQDSTILSRAYSGKLVRGIRNKFMLRMAPYKEEILDYPIQYALTKSMCLEAQKRDNSDFMPMWAGQSAFLSRGIAASSLMRELVSEVNATIGSLSRP